MSQNEELNMNTSNIFKSGFIREALDTIEKSIHSNQFIDVEKSKIELKDGLKLLLSKQDGGRLAVIQMVN